MMKRLFTTLGLLFLLLNARAQSYTWAENVACIFYTHCTGCHFPGGPADFSLIDYGNAFAHKYEIQDAVVEHKMPPWPPEKDYRSFAHERVLTQTEIDIISTWVDQGAMIGDTAFAPNPPPFNAAGSSLSQIDFTGNLGSYVNTETEDNYRCFVIPTSYGVDKYISDIEIIPGNRQMVHHVIIYTDVNNTCVGLDAADPGLGYESFGGTGSNTSKMIGGYVPGSQPLHFPNGMGMKLDVGAYIILQMHYGPGTNGMLDSTRINFTFASGVVRTISLSALLNHNSNITPPLVIPPNTIMNFTETFTIPSVTAGVDSVTVLSVAPHMHNIGTSIKCYAIEPDNDTIPLIDIPHWDFHWQGLYDFRQPLVFPEGTVVIAEAEFNNTFSNPHVIDPGNWVYAGESTDEEMMMVFFEYLLYEPGDAAIIVDTVSHIPNYAGCNFVGIDENPETFSHLSIYPNPSADFVNISFEQLNPEDVRITIIDLSGKVLAEYFQPQVGIGGFNKAIDVNHLAEGMYFARISNGGNIFAKSFVVIK